MKVTYNFYSTLPKSPLSFVVVCISKIFKHISIRLVCLNSSEVPENQDWRLCNVAAGLCSYGCSVLCSVIERISKAGWLQNSLRKPDGKPRDSPWQLLPLCHKQNTRRLSLLPTPTGLGSCQTEQSLSQPLFLSNVLALPLSLSLCLLQYKQKRSAEALPLWEQQWGRCLRRQNKSVHGIKEERGRLRC